MPAVIELKPIGLHEVEVLGVEGDTVHVRPLEALDGTPIVDVKPVLRGSRLRLAAIEMRAMCGVV